MSDCENWTPVCRADTLQPERSMRFDLGSRTFAIVRSSEGVYFALDGLCTHEKVHLEGGLVEGNTIECPKHFGVFDCRTGEAMGPPVCVDLHTYPVRVEAGVLFIDVR